MKDLYYTPVRSKENEPFEAVAIKNDKCPLPCSLSWKYTCSDICTFVSACSVPNDYTCFFVEMRTPGGEGGGNSRCFQIRGP